MTLASGSTGYAAVIDVPRRGEATGTGGSR